MPDCSFGDLGCYAQDAANSAFDNIARLAGQAAAQMIGQSFTFWVDSESVNPDSEAVRNLQQYTVPIALAMLTGSILVQSIRMMLSRSKDPAINVGLGLIRYAIVTTVGLGLLAGTLRAGDDFSSWLVDQSMGDFAQRMEQMLGGGPGANVGQDVDAIGNSFLLMIVSLVGLILGAIQWLIAFIRQAGILVLATMLPLAASGSINDSTKVWMSRLMPWLIALVLYKPMAAMIYAIGFTLLGDGQDFATVMTGLMVMVLAAIAMPAMLRFFSWTQVSATGGAGAGGVIAAGATGAASMAALRSARGIQMTGPGSASTGAGGSGSVGAATGGGPPALPGPSGGSGSAGGGPGPTPGGGGSGASAPRGDSPGGLGDTRSPAGASGTPAGATSAPAAGVPAARAGGGVPPSGGGDPAAPQSPGGAAAGGPPPGGSTAAPGGAAAAGGAVARGAYQAGHAAADGFTQGEGPKQ